MKISWFSRIIWNIWWMLSVTIVLVRLFSPSITLAASEFSPYAESLAMSGIISVQPTEAGYRLSDTITRAEITKIVMGLAGSWSVGCVGDIFTDVNRELGDLCSFIESAAEAGIISIDDMTFRPLDPVTRIEMVKILLAAISISPSDTPSGFTDVDASMGDLYGYLNAAVEKGIVGRTVLFRPTDRASRGEVFKIAISTQNLSTTVTPPLTGTQVSPATEMVTIQNFAYAPSPLTVRVGTKVIWENKDTIWHTVTFPTFWSPLLAQNDRYEYIFTQTGTYQYLCTPHPTMLGTVVVTE